MFETTETSSAGLDDAARGVQLRWVDPGAPSDAAGLAAWRALVGPPVLLQGPDTAGRVVDALAVVTWNTRAGGGDLLRLVGDLRAGRLTGGEPVTDFVLLLQEVYRAGAAVPPVGAAAGGAPRRIAAYPPAGRRMDVVGAAQRLELSAFYVPSMRNGRLSGEGAEDRGNAILATASLAEPTAVELPYEAQRRVAVGATVAGTASTGTPWRLFLASVHLDVRSRWTRLAASAGSARLRQARALLGAIPGDGSAVIGGDFNTWAGERLEAAVPLLRRAFPSAPGDDGRPTFAFGRRLDHLFFRLPQGASADVRRLDDRYGSDHFPVLGRIRWSGRVQGQGWRCDSRGLGPGL